MSMVHQSLHVLIDTDESDWQGQAHDAYTDHHGQDSALLRWPLDVGCFIEQDWQNDQKYATDVTSDQGEDRVDIWEQGRHADDQVWNSESSNDEFDSLHERRLWLEGWLLLFYSSRLVN